MFVSWISHAVVAMAVTCQAWVRCHEEATVLMDEGNSLCICVRMYSVGEDLENLLGQAHTSQLRYFMFASGQMQSE